MLLVWYLIILMAGFFLSVMVAGSYRMTNHSMQAVISKRLHGIERQVVLITRMVRSELGILKAPPSSGTSPRDRRDEATWLRQLSENPST